MCFVGVEGRPRARHDMTKMVVVLRGTMVTE